METTPLHVSEAIALINQTFEYAYPVLIVEGEVASFKVNQNKYVFFDIKDETGTLSCFMTVYQLRIPIEDGMKVQVIAQPKLTQWGKFSLTVRDVKPIGEGNLKRAFELLQAKLDKEGLFAVERKRSLPPMPSRIGVISSVQAAGYADFIKIIGQRWGGIELVIAHTQVQGAVAADQIIRAIIHLNEMAHPPEIIVIIRGGGSADDLKIFNDEPLVRAIATSRTPVVTGIGHEVDISLSDLAADLQAATPSNAAQLITPDKHDVIRSVDREIKQMVTQYEDHLSVHHDNVRVALSHMMQKVERIHGRYHQSITEKSLIFSQLDPKQILKRGYSLVRNGQGKLISCPKVGDVVTIETKDSMISAGVKHVNKK